MIDIKEIEDQIMEQEKGNTDHSMAYLLLMEVKASAKRWFIIAVVELVIMLGIIFGMIWYNSLPSESYNSTIETDGNANTVVGIGDNNYGDESNGISENKTW